MAFDGEKFGQTIVEEVRGYVERRLRERDASLEARIAALEGRQMAYRGVWQGSQSYERGAFVSHGGSLWHAESPTKEKPGESRAWTLAVKRGADAREA